MMISIDSAHYILSENLDWSCGQQKLDAPHGNAPAHSSHLIHNSAKHNNLVHQAVYSPNMAACSYWLFPS